MDMEPGEAMNVDDHPASNFDKQVSYLPPRDSSGESGKEYLQRKMGGSAKWFKEPSSPGSARSLMKYQMNKSLNISDSVRHQDLPN